VALVDAITFSDGVSGSVGECHGDHEDNLQQQAGCKSATGPLHQNSLGMRALSL